MALNLLPLFMAAIRRRESGSYLGNYSARNGRTGAYGAYQIMPGNWAPWAAQAGIPGADRRSKAAQDYVAEYKMRQYYARYGDWGLVAIAWYAGPSRADRAAREGINSVSGIMDRHTGGTVGAYVAGIMEYMQDPEAQKVAGVSIQEEAAPGMDDPFASFYTSAPFMGALNSAFTGSFEINQDSGNATRDALTVLLDELSHASAGGQRQYPGANFPSQAMGTLQGGFHEGWVFPVAGPNEWSRGSYGYRRTPSQVKAGKSPVHQGIDIFAERGTPVIAPVGGVVVSKGNGKIAGHYVKIRGDDGITYYFAHLNAPPLVGENSRVEAGYMLGEVGNSGNAVGTSPHLHFTMRNSDGALFNPADYLEGAQPGTLETFDTVVSGEEPSIENTLETLDQAVAETPEFVEGEAQTLEPTRIEADPEAAEIDDKDQQSEAQLTQIEGPF